MNKQLTQSSTFSVQQKESLLLLQEFLHHKDLRIPASSSTEERIQAYNEKFYPPLSDYLENRLRKASQDVAGWIWQNKASLYKIVYSVIRKNQQLVGNGFYDEDELFNILFIQSMRILYNYDFNNPKDAKPLTYLIHTLHQRKNELIALPTPYSDDVELYL